MLKSNVPEPPVYGWCSEGKCFMGGDIIMSLYQTARFGNFSYHFQNLEYGHYIVDLHPAEIVFTEGPS